MSEAPMSGKSGHVEVLRPAVRVIADYRCHCGENPLWDERRGLLYWTDIPTGRLFRWDSGSGEHRQIYQGDVVGGFTLQEDGSLLLFGDNRIALLRDDGVKVLREPIEPGIQRFNDVIADPRGRVFAGTMGREMEGGLYRVDPDGSIRNLFRGTNCANGMGFSPDLRHFYWTCSTTRRIFRFRYDIDTGELSDREVLVQVPEGSGVPDGMSVDEQGHLWSARWEGGAIWRYAPDGTAVSRIELPLKIPSSVVFGSPEMRTLFITTAGGQSRGAGDVPGGQAAAGAVLAAQLEGVRGRPEFRSRFPAG